MSNIDAVGQGLAGALITTALFRTLIERGLLAPEDGTAILNRAIDAVRRPVTVEDLSALKVLEGLHRQLHT